jgi:hypothetical protein
LTLKGSPKGEHSKFSFLQPETTLPQSAEFAKSKISYDSSLKSESHLFF